MAKSIIVVSSMVNATVKEYQPDVHWEIFGDLQSLGAYIEQNPLRADEMFFTRDVIPMANASLVYLFSLLENPFLSVDKVVYITEEGSPEIHSVEYLIKDKGLENWEIVKGSLTREYVDGIINGTMRTDNIESRRKTVWRVPRAEYVKEHGKTHESMEQEYEDDDHYLQGIPDEEPPVELIPEVPEVGEIVHIAGRSDTLDRTLFAFIAAQYLSTYGKTLIVEYDVRYHQLTEFVTKSQVPCCQIEMQDLLLDINKALYEIRHTPFKLVVVGAVELVEYSYSFITQVLYNTLCRDIKYFIQEDNFSEAPVNSKFVAVINNNIPDALRLSDGLDSTVVENARVVALNTNLIMEEKFEDSIQMNTLLKDLTGLEVSSVTFVTLQSLLLKENSGCDLRQILL